MGCSSSRRGEITRQIAAALAAAHSAGVVHRDLKPGNIMLEGAGEGVKAVVTDFGIAREYQADATAVTGAQLTGTPGYIAPEVWRGQPATPASDLYALGVVLHEIFTGSGLRTCRAAASTLKRWTLELFRDSAHG